MSQCQALFAQDGQHVFNEVVSILIADLDSGIHTIPYLRRKTKRSNSEGT